MKLEGIKLNKLVRERQIPWDLNYKESQKKNIWESGHHLVAYQLNGYEFE